ncbi:Hypothetical Protein FCC1311_096192 [Hondaea fermentalgiana]|uniref:Casein kinase substrate phosphoprotein PP28 domain-containing protein n=1 Tax=Hondaea fermentalgiana TaxID=2315210 RepID=A0A2R5GR83_9STRA|nr:Hypothetical Protein FCC1311_096192 [Hondaea fermentalgiana]|eukprot:GBG33396.1 Hypothetical Protein FCC1311_096192 [Hondaea fermentalgiana]
MEDADGALLRAQDAQAEGTKENGAGYNSDLDLDFGSSDEEDKGAEDNVVKNDDKGAENEQPKEPGSDVVASSNTPSGPAGGTGAAPGAPISQTSVDEVSVGVEEMRVTPQTAVFTKEKSLAVQDLVEIDNPNYVQETPEQQAAREAEAAAKLLAAERKEEMLIASGQTIESAADLERLEEIRAERERNQRRREREAAKKEKLRVAAAERAAELEAKARAKAAGGGQKSKKKKGKKR